MGTIRVVKAGLLTTVQDLGRWGFQAQGVPVCGAMDVYSHRLANALVGNHPDAASIEITLMGPELVFEDARLVAIAGAEFDVRIDGELMPHASPISAGVGATLSFGARRRGARAYLAVAGGIDVPEVLGSRSTHVPSRMGGFGGRALVSGDRLRLGSAPSGSTLEGLGRRRAPPGIGRTSIRVLAGPHDSLFADDALDVLQSSRYSIAVQSDRMGYRLDGPALALRSRSELISGATTAGALQVPLSGQPILLMADRQTTGGYAAIATVITADLGHVAQMGPGESLAFEACTKAEALAALIAQERALMRLERIR